VGALEPARERALGGTRKPRHEARLSGAEPAN
jgi:hypothetical protein